MFIIVLILFIPILFLKEIPNEKFRKHTLKEFFFQIWDTMKNLTTLYLLLYVIGIVTFAQLTNNASTYIQVQLIIVIILNHFVI